MSKSIVLSGARWMSVKWWSCNGREDLTARAVICVDSLRAAGFMARVGERRNDAREEYARTHPGEYCPYEVLLRVEVYGPDEVHHRARHHLRGLWAALESKGMPKDYRIGYSTGVAILQDKTEKVKQLPIVKLKQLGERNGD